MLDTEFGTRFGTEFGAEHFRAMGRVPAGGLQS